MSECLDVVDVPMVFSRKLMDILVEQHGGDGGRGTIESILAYACECKAVDELFNVDGRARFLYAKALNDQRSEN